MKALETESSLVQATQLVSGGGRVKPDPSLIQYCFQGGACRRLALNPKPAELHIKLETIHPAPGLWMEGSWLPICPEVPEAQRWLRLA